MPFAFRVIPEVLMGPYPTGFDSIAYYIPTINNWVSHGVNWQEFIAEAPLFYCILMFANRMGTDIILTLKVVSLILHGLLGLVIYLYARKALSWSYSKSLAVSLFATLYFTSLRVSWDMLRQQLGLIFLFASFNLFYKVLEKKSLSTYFLFSLSTTSTILAHQLPAVIMFACIAVLIVDKIRSGWRREYAGIGVSLTPSILVFLLILFSVEFSIVSGNNGFEVPSNWQILLDYKSYWDMAFKTVGFLAYCYLPIALPIVPGILRVKKIELKIWIILCLSLVMLPLLSLGFRISVPEYRWTLLLGYPLSFYAIEGLSRIRSNYIVSRGSSARKVMIVSILFISLLSIGFMVMPVEIPLPYFDYSKLNGFIYYMPSSMLQNTISMKDCKDVDNALEWMKDNMSDRGILLSHIAFRGQALLKLGEGQTLYYGYGFPEEAASVALEEGYQRVFLVWWIEGEGWYGQPTVSSLFKEVYRSGEIAIYLYTK